MAKLRIIYRNLMTISYDNARTRSRTNLGAATEAERKRRWNCLRNFTKNRTARR